MNRRKEGLILYIHIYVYMHKRHVWINKSSTVSCLGERPPAGFDMAASRCSLTAQPTLLWQGSHVMLEVSQAA
jgi:hypothetical protein